MTGLAFRRYVAKVEAGPEMLEALKVARTFLESDSRIWEVDEARETFEVIEAAIAKAEVQF